MVKYFCLLILIKSCQSMLFGRIVPPVSFNIFLGFFSFGRTTHCIVLAMLSLESHQRVIKQFLECLSGSPDPLDCNYLQSQLDSH